MGEGRVIRQDKGREVGQAREEGEGVTMVSHHSPKRGELQQDSLDPEGFSPLGSSPPSLSRKE